MLRVENEQVFNLDGAIRNMRNSWNSWHLSDSSINGSLDNDNVLDIVHPANIVDFHLGEADKKLAQKLLKAGPDHAKFLRMILVSFDLIAGNEFFKEFDTYKIGTSSNSTSAMHLLGKRLLTEDDLSFDMPYSEAATEVLNRTNDLIKAWWDSGKKTGSKEWRDLQKGVPMGFVYRRGITANYQVLQNMYHSRKNHRLYEWREFCSWIETLPYSFLITGKETVLSEA